GNMRDGHAGVAESVQYLSSPSQPAYVQLRRRLSENNTAELVPKIVDVPRERHHAWAVELNAGQSRNQFTRHGCKVNPPGRHDANLVSGNTDGHHVVSNQPRNLIGQIVLVCLCVEGENAGIVFELAIGLNLRRIDIIVAKVLNQTRRGSVILGELHLLELNP